MVSYTIVYQAARTVALLPWLPLPFRAMAHYYGVVRYGAVQLIHVI